MSDKVTREQIEAAARRVGEQFMFLPEAELSNPYLIMVERILPKVVERFLLKSSDYGPEGFQELGLKGQYSEIHRKVKKLKRAMWENWDLENESLQEVLMDLFGHIMISLYLEEGERHPKAQAVWNDTGRCSVNDIKGNRCRLADHPPGTDHLFPERTPPTYPLPSE